MASSESTDQLEIHVKMMGMIGKGNNESVLTIFIDGSSNVLDLKKKISTELQLTNDDIGIERQRLIFLGRMLREEEHNLIRDARMKTEAVNWIHLCPLPVGARPSARDEEETRTFQPQPDSSPSRQLRGVRDRRRNRMESFFHPYAMTVPTRVVVSARNGGFFSAFSTSVPGSSGAVVLGQGITNATSSSSEARSGSTRRSRAAPARASASTVNTRSGTDNDESPESPSELGIMSMLERSIEGAASASRDRSDLMRRAHLTELLELTARSAATSSSSASVATRPRSERAAAAPVPAATATSRRAATRWQAPQTSLRRSTRRRTGHS